MKMKMNLDNTNQIAGAIYRKIHKSYNTPVSKSDAQKFLRELVKRNKQLFRSKSRIRVFLLLSSLDWVTTAQISNCGKNAPARPRRGIKSLRTLFTKNNLPFEIIFKRKYGYRLNLISSQKKP